MTDRKANFSRITFVRHGESIGNLENRMQGLSDYPLSDTGRQQARALAQCWLADGTSFDAAIASPLSRASETAQILVDRLHIPTLEFDPLWVERDMGTRSGMTVDEIQAKFPEPEFVNPYDSVDESGESDWALYLRAGQALHKVIQRPSGSYLVVTHGAILNMAIYAILGISPHPNFQGPHFSLENTGIASFRYYPDLHVWRVDRIGDRAHWPVKTS
ncbi:MAG: histidine phosphatase family protein [Chloroflexota bacterium]